MAVPCSSASGQHPLRAAYFTGHVRRGIPAGVRVEHEDQRQRQRRAGRRSSLPRLAAPAGSGGADRPATMNTLISASFSAVRRYLETLSNAHVDQVKQRDALAAPRPRSRPG